MTLHFKKRGACPPTCASAGDTGLWAPRNFFLRSTFHPSSYSHSLLLPLAASERLIWSWSWERMGDPLPTGLLTNWKKAVASRGDATLDARLSQNRLNFSSSGC